ncbi:MAG TPA: hypothetical protein VN414_09700 [Methanosarcina sp.]|nr:hypothetical protein [Methanosarcina sp.]
MGPYDHQVADEDDREHSIGVRTVSDIVHIISSSIDLIVILLVGSLVDGNTIFNA